jgi:hypothetical protein
MNILVVIVMAVIWMVGGIIKAVKAKTEDQQQKRNAPIRKPSDQRRGVQQQQKRQVPVQRTHRPAGPAKQVEQPSIPRKRSTLADLREAARRFAAEAEQAFKEPDSKHKPAPRPSQKTKDTPKLQIYQDTTPETEAKTVSSPIIKTSDKQDSFAKTAASQQLYDLISDYDDPEKLRKAILHYEILGPPLSLRN